MDVRFDWRAHSLNIFHNCDRKLVVAQINRKSVHEAKYRAFHSETRYQEPRPNQHDQVASAYSPS